MIEVERWHARSVDIVSLYSAELLLLQLSRPRTRGLFVLTKG